MTQFTDDLSGLVIDLLGEFGEAISFSHTTPGAYVPSTGLIGAGTTTTWAGFGSPITFTQAQIAQQIVLAADINLLAQSSTVPQVNDLVTFAGVVYQILTVTPTRVSGVSVIYELHLRV